MEMQERPQGQRYQTEDLLWYRVTIDGDIEHSRALVRWCIDQPFEISTGWDFQYALRDDAMSMFLFDEFLGFTDPQHAMLFKLTWQGVAAVKQVESYTG